MIKSSGSPLGDLVLAVIAVLIVWGLLGAVLTLIRAFVLWDWGQEWWNPAEWGWAFRTFFVAYTAWLVAIARGLD